MHRTIVALIISLAMTIVTLGPAPVAARDRAEPAVVALFVLLAAAIEKQRRQESPDRIAPDQGGERQAQASHQDRSISLASNHDHALQAAPRVFPRR